MDHTIMMIWLLMSGRKTIEYEIKIEGYDSIKGSIRTNPNESMTSIREKI